MLQPDEAALPGPTVGRAGRTDDRVRSFLVQAAVEGRPFGLAVDRARRSGIARDVVVNAAHQLRESELLRFGDPLDDSTRIRLR